MAMGVLACGILAAGLAGVADFLAALVSRHLGSVRTLLLMAAGSAALLLPVQLFLGGGAVSGRDGLVLFIVAGSALAGYLAFYRALALGPVAVVSPVAACDGAVAALLGVIVLGERPTTWQLACVVLLVVGVALAASDWRGGWAGLRANWKGPLWALVTLFGFGVAIAGVGALSRTCGSAVLPVLLLRGVILLPLLPAARGLAGTQPRLLGLAVVVGLLDTAALLAVAQGSLLTNDASVSILGPLYGAYPIVTVTLATVVLRERLAPNQWLGIAFAVVGTFLLAL